MRLFIVLAVAALSLAGCGGGKPPATASSTTSPTQAASPSPSARTDRDGDGILDVYDNYPDDPNNKPPQTTVTLECNPDGAYGPGDLYSVVVDASGKPDFAPVWAVKLASCEVSGTIVPSTDFEMSVYKTSGYDDNDISTLYTICAEVDPTDTYAETGYAASESQIPEINAALMLCPKHPLAGKWRQAVQRGKADIELEAQGRLFGAGTFLVGKEIRPGTYFTTNVEGCYWERQNSSGEIKDNNFILSARRVQITIRSSDYAFHSRGCGEWRPV